MKSRMDQLVEVLRELESRLEDGGRSHWVEWLSKSRREIEAGDLHGVRYLLQAYGGMGSFNDVCVEPRGGHPVTLDELRSRAFELAREILANAALE